ncbi:hypothetical protein [Tumebacillus lipolyticus]|uniref:Spore germination protein n=1 Tax=Tumebacillus lipolyticus TaxID=1280370 RepID=A0ABW4ZYK2_9BACL
MAVQIQTISGGTVVFGTVGCVCTRTSSNSVHGAGSDLIGDGGTTISGISSTNASGLAPNMNGK